MLENRAARYICRGLVGALRDINSMCNAEFRAWTRLSYSTLFSGSDEVKFHSLSSTPAAAWGAPWSNAPSSRRDEDDGAGLCVGTEGTRDANGSFEGAGLCIGAGGC